MRILRWIIKLLPFVYMSFIWYLSDRSADAVVNFKVYDGFIKESLHLVEFAILYGLFVLYLIVDGNLTVKTNFFVAVLASCYGLVDEIHQYFVPSRSASIIDLIKDVTGVTVSYWIVKQGYFADKNFVGKLLKRIEASFVKTEVE